MTFRGLTFKEAWRFGKEPLKFSIAVLLKLIGFKGPKQWLPAHECESPVDETQLSPGAQQYLLPVANEARSLGYECGQFYVMSRNLDRNTKEGYAYVALHHDKARILFIGYIWSEAGLTSQRVVAITGGLSTPEYEDIEFVNHPNFFDSGPWAHKVRVSGKKVGDIDAAMQNYVRQSRSLPRQFSSIADVRAHSAKMGIKAYDERIARGLFLYVGDEPGMPPLLPVRENS